MHIWCSTIYIKIIGDAAALLVAEQLHSCSIAAGLLRPASVSMVRRRAMAPCRFRAGRGAAGFDEGLLGHRGMVEFDDVVTR